MWSQVHHLLFLIASATLAHAAYNIDDRNTSIHYSQVAIAWDHKSPGIPNNSADANKCHDQTYTVNHLLCKDSDGCYIQIPFTGSGITIYAIQSPDPVSAKMTIDGKSSSVYSLDPLGTFQYQVVLYDVQSLPYADHMLDIALVNYNYANGTSMGSLIRFDYAAVNDTQPPSGAQPSTGQSASRTAGSSSSASAAPSPSTTRSTNSRSIIGIAVGAAVGGVVVFALAVLAIFCCLKRRKSRTATGIVRGPELTAPALAPYEPYGNPTEMTHSQLAQSYSYSALPTQSSPSPIPSYGRPQSLLAQSRASDTPPSDWGAAAVITPFSPGDGHISDAPLATPPSRTAKGANLLVSDPNRGIPAALLDPPSRSSIAMHASSEFAAGPSESSLLSAPVSGPTDDQLVQHLRNLNIPEVDIVTVIAALRGSKEAAPSSSSLLPAPTGGLADDQLVQHLRNLNIPEVDIVTVIATLRRSREVAFPNPEGPRDYDSPPSYDFKGGM